MPRLARVALWLGLLGTAILIAARTQYTADLSAFLPRSATALQQMLVDQLREGPASRLLLVAIEGGDAPTRAVWSGQLRLGLASRPEFSGVDNGAADTQVDREFLFTHRYVLSDSVNPQRFTSEGLHAAIADTIDALSSGAGLLTKSLLPSDPTGEMLQILQQLDRRPQPRSVEGVWSSADGERALLVARTRAAGSDTNAQEKAIQAIRETFAAIVSQHPAATAPRLRLTGPGVFAVSARNTIEHEAIRLSICSGALILALLLFVYRSALTVLFGLLPVVSGALAGIAAVALGFGSVHGITLGFGITLIGESVDYSIYLFVQSRSAEPGEDGIATWQRRFWPTVRLGVLTSICGFASLLPSAFPGLAQLGLYSIAGLIAAALVTRYVLPELLPRRLAIRELRPLGAFFHERLRALRRGWLIPAIMLVLSAAILLAHRHDLWNEELSALSPVSAADQRLDETLRADLGAPDVRDLVLVWGPTLEAALRAAENAGLTLQELMDAGAIGGFESPAQILPSLLTQARRRDSLPDPALLQQRLDSATRDLALRSERLDAFRRDVQAARAEAPLDAGSLKGTALANLFDSLLIHRGDRWTALLPLYAPGGRAAPDLAQVSARLHCTAADACAVLDLKSESNALYAGYLSEAIRLSLAGFAALIVLLGITLRSATRLMRVLAPLMLAVLCVAAGLAATGQKMILLHLIGMLLIVAVGSNYALFFDRPPQIDASHQRMLASLLIANATTVIGFGVLAFSHVPVLHALGSTVAPGAWLALLFSALLSRQSSPA